MKINFGKLRRGLLTDKGILYEEYCYRFNNITKWKFWGIEFKAGFFGFIIKSKG